MTDPPQNPVCALRSMRRRLGSSALPLVRCQHSQHRRSRITAFIILGCISLGCGKAAKTTPRALHMFIREGLLTKAVIDLFVAKEGVRIYCHNYSYPGQLRAMLADGKIAADLLIGAGDTVEVLQRERLVSPLRHAHILNLRNVMRDFPSRYLDQDLRYCVPFTRSVLGIGFDDRAVAKAAVQSWSVLFDPQYKMKLAMLDDERATMGMALRSLGFSANTRKVAEIIAAKKKLIAQKFLLHRYAGSDLPRLIASGQDEIAYARSSDIFRAAQINSHIRFHVPQEGSAMYVYFICIPSPAPHPELAERFIDFILDEKVSSAIWEASGDGTMGDGARAPAAFQTRELWSLSHHPGELEHVEIIRDLGPDLKLYNEAWREVKASAAWLM